MNISTRSEMNVNACFSANAFKKFLSRITMMLSLFLLVNAQGWGQTTVTYAQRASHYNAGSVFTVGTAGMFDAGSHQVGMYANSGATKQVVAWRTLKTAGDNTGSNRSLQVGDEFRISVSANTVVGEMGFALLSSPSSRSSWNDRLNNAEVSVRLSNYGNWYATYSDGSTANAATSTGSNNIGGNTSYKNFVFTCLLTAPNRMNITITDGSTTSNLYDVLLNNSNAITEYSIFLSDDWNGVQHSDIYWNTNSGAASDYVKNTLTMPIGSSNGNFTISGVLPNGLAANSTSTASVNALTKTGTGALTLTGANTYTGTTTIDGGELWIGSGGSIASTATLTVGNAAATTAKLFLSKSDGGTTFSNNITISNGNANTRYIGSLNTSGTNTFSGNILRSSTQPLNIEVTSSGGSLTVSGVINGSGSVAKDGSGSLSLSGANTFTGATTISSGTLSLGASSTSSASGPLGTNAAGTSVSSGAVLDMNGFSLTSTATEALTISGTGISSGGALINTSGTGSTWAGTVALGSDASIGGSGNTTISGVISGANNLTKVGAGTLTLSTTNLFGGSGKSLTIAAGTVAITSFTNNLGDASNTVTLGTTSTSGTLEFTPATGDVNRSFTVASGGGTLKNLGANIPTFANNAGANTVTLNGDLTLNCSSTGDMAFNLNISGTGGIIVNSSGAGKVLLQPALAGSSTYTGSTTVTSGSLYLRGANLVSNSSNLILNGGTFGTGVTTGYSETLGTLALTANSTIALGTGSHTLTFSASDAVAWTAGRTLTITGWSGTAGATGSAGKIFVGSSSSGLTSTQLAQISFTGYGAATILSTGEIVPTATLYRSAATTGNWNNAATWESSTDGLTWSAAASTPSSTDGTITIRNGHTVTITVAVSIDQVTVDNGGIVIHSGAGTVTLADGTGTDLTINGTWRRTVSTHAISISSGATISVGSTGIYEHELAAGGGSIPTATWNSTSILRIKNNTSSSSALTNLAQTFGIVEVNTSTHTDAFVLDGITDVTNEFRIIQTGTGAGLIYTTSNWTITGSIVQSGGKFTNNFSNSASTTTIGGGLTISGGTFEVSNSGGSAIHSVIVNGNVLVNGGSLEVNKSALTAGRLYVKGNLTLSSGSIVYTQGGTTGSSGIYFDGSGAQTFTHSGGTLSTATGAIGRRFYYKTTSGPTALNETYSSSSAQSTISGSEGTAAAGYAAWPTGSLINGFTVSNSAGVTLSTNKLITGTVTLSSGSLNLGGNTLTLNSGASAQSVTGAGSNAFNITNGTISLTGSGTHTITLSNFGTSSSGGLTLGTDVTLRMDNNASLNCGGNGTTTSMLTVLGTMIMNSVTASNIDGGKPPFYGNASTLEYRVSYNVFDEWKSGTAITTPGVPQNVTINGSGITITTPASERNVKGNLLISAGNFTLNGTVGGDLKVAGNITNSATFTHNDRAVYLNGASAQTLNGTLNGTTTTNCFPYLFIDNTSGGITLNTPVNVTNTLTLTTGVITTDNTNILNITATGTGAISGGGASAYINGPLRRALPSSLSSGSTYVFPVGKSGYYPISLVNPTTTSGTITITAEAFNTGSGGSAGSGMTGISTSEYWSVASSSNFTNSSYSVSRPTAVSPNNNIGRSTILTGAYAAIGGSASGTSITNSNTASGAAQQYFVLGQAGVPTITVSTASLSDFGNVCTGSSSSESSYTVSGSNLTANITVTAPTGFQVSTTSGSSFGSSVTLTQSSGSVASTTIYVRFSPSAAGSATGDISHTSTSATTQNVSVSGSGNAAGTWIGGSTGNWNDGSNWCGGVPSATTDVIIPGSTTITVNATSTAKSVTINGTLLGSSNTLTVSGNWTNNGTFTAGTGTVAFNAAAAVSGTANTTFNNVTISAGVNFGSSKSTVNGNLTINAGGFVNTNPPTYGSSSTLIYNTGGSYGRGFEWSATSGPGYPNNVQISGAGTILSLGANSGTGTARQLAGNLTVDAGTTLTLNATGEVMTQALTVKGNYINNGTTTLSGSAGGDLKLEGNLNDNGTFNANSRAIFFEGGNVQTINSTTDPLDIDVMRIGKSAGEVRLLQNLLVDETADPIQFTNGTSILNLNGKNVTFGKAGTASAISMTAESAIKSTSASSLTILGTGAFGTIRFDQSTPGTTNVLNNLTVTRTSGSVTLGNALIVAGTVDVAGGATLTTGGNLTLRSDADGTARVADLSDNSGGTISGNVTVERYVSARRRWRALTAPLLGSGNVSIYDTWQNGGTPSGSTGAIMWKLGADEGATGLYNGGAATSILEYNSAGNSWTALSTTKGANLFTSSGNNAYMVFVTGPYNTSGTNVTSGAAATTLSATGTLRKGPINYSSDVTSGKFYMIGNPFASSINLKAISRTGYGNNAYIWSPGLASVGGWVTANMDGASDISVESGQAFFLYASTGTNTLSIEESDKITGSSLTYFRTEETKVDGEMNIELNKYVDGKAELYDMASINYKGGTDDRLPKLAQIYENLSVYQNGADFGVANRTLVNGEDNVQLRIWQMNEANYQLKINLSSIKLPAGTTAVLADAFLNKETSLSLTGDNVVDFNVTNNAATSGQRFRIVLRRGSIPVTNIEEAKPYSIYPNPVAKGGSMQLQFTNRAAGKYTVSVFTITGVRVQQQVVSHSGGTTIQTLSIDNRLSAGSYLVEVMNEKGEKEQVKLTLQ